MTPFSDDELGEFYRDIERRTAGERPPRRPRVPQPTHIPCPTPDKSDFSSSTEVADALDRARRERPRGPDLRSYHCVCGAWHITSSPPRPALDDPTARRTGRKSSGRKGGRRR